ncbi:MAG: hypothetical protein E3K37_00770 [Candidatus Kuenenia sp.]|nr:hypothetical protein [Candidatus Kuenenia hertensis]
MGSMNDLAAEDEYKFTDNEGLYTLEVRLSADNNYTFRIADASWNDAHKLRRTEL